MAGWYIPENSFVHKKRLDFPIALIKKNGCTDTQTKILVFFAGTIFSNLFIYD